MFSFKQVACGYTSQERLMEEWGVLQPFYTLKEGKEGRGLVPNTQREISRRVAKCKNREKGSLKTFSCLGEMEGKVWS